MDSQHTASQVVLGCDTINVWNLLTLGQISEQRLSNMNRDHYAPGVKVSSQLCLFTERTECKFGAKVT